MNRKVRKEYYQQMRDTLNESGIPNKMDSTKTWRNIYNDDDVMDFHKNHFFGSEILTNKEAFDLLKSKGFFNKGICPECGETPINDTYIAAHTFNHSMQFPVCSVCISKDRLVPVKGNTARQESNSGCYIATACYGDYNSTEVLAFRVYRDEKLSNSFLGRLFIRVYYKLSPPIANWLKNKHQINNIVKKRLLDPLYNKIKND